MASARISDDEPFLPSDVITNILKRLPIKSIIRFRRVCKEWRNLFRTHSFIYDHFQSNPDHHNYPFLLLHEANDMFPYVLSLLNHNMQISDSFNIPKAVRHLWEIIGSCNGLICVRGENGFGTCNAVGVWNPVIRETRIIPLSSKDNGHCHGFGFGYSSVVNDYKIVRFYNQACRKMEELEFVYDRVEVFSSRTGLWKKLEFSFGDLGSFRRFTSAPVNIDGTICWFGKFDSSYMIVSFDVATEVFTITPIEIEVSALETTQLVSPIGLGVYDNKLEVHFLSIGFPYFIHVWVMDEVTSEIGKEFIVVKKYKFGPMAERLYPICIRKHELVCIDGGLSGGLTLFNLITNERRDFDDLNVNTSSGVYNYEKSLVSVWNNF